MPEPEAARIVQTYRSILTASEPMAVLAAQRHLAERLFLPKGWTNAALALMASHPRKDGHSAAHPQSK
ncbi:hypothetical protein N803_01745 [Knoellia subterranea KCTC 19937]|uniref:Uncharacterized protein n=1 Tax=Knoellia subterranea KCTC 19937 TaxID=1385521 RepID=A0A0A0JSB4_9MICO|nr:hypothetical protein N803_01745 [Knoellia subterranea KCTC 19937]